MITDRIGRSEVLLPINQNYSKICEILDFFKSKHKKSRECFAISEKSRLACTLLSYNDGHLTCV